MINYSVFSRLIVVLGKSDPLLQLNTLAVLKLLLVFPDGRAFLQSSGAVAHLFSSLQTLRKSPLHGILLPGGFVILLLHPFRISQFFRNPGWRGTYWFSHKSDLQTTPCQLSCKLPHQFWSSYHRSRHRNDCTNLQNHRWEESPRCLPRQGFGVSTY